jgi:glycosyltransferase involved in cell wall biosynthesis
MMRVLHVMARMAPGGTEHQLVGMLGAAHGRHWEAGLCVLSAGWELTGRVREIGVQVHELEGSRFDPRLALQLRRLAVFADLIHVSLPAASVYARLVTSGPRRPAVVVSERGIESHRHPALYLAGRLLRPITDAYIGNSPAVTDFIRRAQRLGPEDPRVFEVPNGIDASTFHPNGRHQIGRRRLVGVGRLIDSKGFDLAISLLPRLAGEVDVELVIAGEGPERGRLQSLAQGLPVTFLGHIADRTALADLLRTSDVLVVPSRSEGRPNAVMEALACGVRVVASDIPGNQAVAGEGVTLVADDEQAWCQAVVSAVNAGPLPRMVDRFPSFDEVARRHRQVFEFALRRKGARKASRHDSSPQS